MVRYSRNVKLSLYRSVQNSCPFFDRKSRRQIETDLVQEFLETPIDSRGGQFYTAALDFRFYYVRVPYIRVRESVNKKNLPPPPVPSVGIMSPVNSSQLTDNRIPFMVAEKSFRRGVKKNNTRSKTVRVTSPTRIRRTNRNTYVYVPRHHRRLCTGPVGWKEREGKPPANDVHDNYWFEYVRACTL